MTASTSGDFAVPGEVSTFKDERLDTRPVLRLPGEKPARLDGLVHVCVDAK